MKPRSRAETLKKPNRGTAKKKSKPARGKESAKTPSSKSRKSFRVGRVTVFLRNKIWYVRYSENSKRKTQSISDSRKDAERIAAEINSQMLTGVPSSFGFEKCLLSEIQKRWLNHHEDVRRSALTTIRRYRAATSHLIRFADDNNVLYPSDFTGKTVEQFVRFLRNTRVGANGHDHAEQRFLRDSGVKYILQTSSNLFNYAKRHRHLPPYAENPFVAIEIGKIPIEDAKEVTIFSPDEERSILEACDERMFPIMLTLLQTGLRPRELIHMLLPNDVSLKEGWIWIRNKPRLGWQVKTRTDRKIPISAELCEVIKVSIGKRITGPLFRQKRCFFNDHVPPLNRLDEKGLEREVETRSERLAIKSDLPRREIREKAARSVWRDTGAIKYDRLRQHFLHVMNTIGRPDITALKTCRHNFATSLQDSNVDPLIRNELLGHSPGGLGMTTRYTHSRHETKRKQLLEALRNQESTKVALEWLAKRVS